MELYYQTEISPTCYRKAWIFGKQERLPSFLFKSENERF